MIICRKSFVETLTYVMCCFTSVTMVGRASAANPGESDEATDNLAEIVVTATRREESLQKVPMSVAVVSGQALENAGAFDFNDAGFSTANVVFNSSGSNPYLSGQSFIAIRGILGRAQIYLDDVLLGPGQAAPSQLVEVDHIEILRGPQGTTFGRDTIAGAINVITKKPSFTWTGSVDATGGSYGLHQERLYLSGPIIDNTLAFSVSGFSRINDGVDKTVSGQSVNDTRTQGGRASLLFTPTDTFTAQLSYDYTKDDPHNIWGWHLLYANPGALGDAANPAYIGKVLDQTQPSYTNQTHQGGALRLDWRFDDIKLTSITGWRSTDSLFFQDYDRISLNILNESSEIKQHQWTEELRLDGGFNQVRWLTGLYFLKNDESTLVGDFIGSDATFFGPMPVPELIATNLEHDRLQSTALYGSVDVDITSQITATVGARYTWDRVNSTYAISEPGEFFGYDPGPALPALGPPYVYPTIRANHFSPSASISYAPSTELRTYASVSTGYQAAAYNSQTACEGPTPIAPCLLKPENVTSYELGAKTDFWDHKASLNAALFYMSYRDLQVFQSFLVDGQQIFTNTNAAKSSARGLETEFAVRPIKSLTIDGSLGYERTKYDSYPDAYVPDNSGAATVEDLSGSDLPFAPHFTGAVNVQYQRHLMGTFDGVGRAEVQYRSGFQLSPSAAEVLQVGSQTNFNLALGLIDQTRGWSVWVRARNILNRRYVNNGDINFASNAAYVTLSDPRIISGELRYSF